MSSGVQCRQRMPDRTAPKPKASSSGFATLGLDDAIVASVTSLGYEEPTPVQRETIPLLLEGRDLLGQAATGTGKTAAFALPMLQRIVEPRRRRPPAHRRARARADARAGDAGRRGGAQVRARRPAHASCRSTAARRCSQQIRALERGANIVVATPGRALDHIRRGTLKLDRLDVLVLDEADEMLDMGFAEDLDAILEATPPERQTALFSATMPARILSIAERHLKNPARITIAREKTAAGKLPRVRQVAYIVARAHKPAALERVLDMENPDVGARVLPHAARGRHARRDAQRARPPRRGAARRHGAAAARPRDGPLSRRQRPTCWSRPTSPRAASTSSSCRTSSTTTCRPPPRRYVHRIGRTGRAGRGGTAITLAEPREHRLLRAIEAVTKQKIEVAPMPTVADLRARRLEITRASLRERLLAGDLDHTRVVVESLAKEFDIVDIAAAAVQLAHAAAGGDGDDREIPAAQPPSADERKPRAAAAEDRRAAALPRDQIRRPRRRRDRRRLFVGAGRRAGIRPGDLVGAITGEVGIESRSIGAIEIADGFSLVEVPEALADDVIDALRATKIRGMKVTVRRER